MDVKGYGRVSTCKVKATSAREAKQKALTRYGITVEVRRER